jgi:hypothetical protein
MLQVGFVTQFEQGRVWDRGGCGALGYEDYCELSHALEGIFNAGRVLHG